MRGGYGGGGYGGGGYGGGGYGGGGGGYGSGDDDDSSEEAREEMIEDLEDLIKNLIEPDSWQPDGTIGSLQVWNDRLIVRHTANVHRQLSDLFKELRASQDLQVMVESRFVRLQNNFLEEIGVDLDIILNTGNAGLDNAVTEGAEGGLVGALDPLTGNRVLQSRRFTRLGFLPTPVAAGDPLAQAAYGQPYTHVGMVPSGQPSNYFSRHSTPIPILNNTLSLAEPRATGIPGSLAGTVATTPAFQMFGSFLDNIQVDFLLRATQMDVRSSIVDAPRLVIYNGRQAQITVGTFQNYVATPGWAPAGSGSVSGSAAPGRDPQIGTTFSGRTLDVTATVTADRKYVIMTVRPEQQLTTGFDVFPTATGAVQLPTQETVNIQTNVTVPDGGWLLLGGLKLAGETEVDAGVPIISKIPLLKRAYTNRSHVKDEQIILILIKPTIIIPAEAEDLAYPDLATADVMGS
jgi:general secretion pathway protein D